MPAPFAHDLTGATRYRSGWFGTLVLQVEERYQQGYGARPRYGEASTFPSTRWRDANPNDLRVIDYIERHEEWVASKDKSPPPAPPKR